MGGGGHADTLKAPGSPSIPRRDPYANPTTKALNVLEGFKDAEKRNLEIDAKVLKARALRLQRNKSSLETVSTPVTMVSTRPGDAQWTSCWSYSDPREVSGSYMQQEKMQRVALSMEREQFLSQVDAQHAAEEERQQKELEKEMKLAEAAASKKAHEDRIYNQMMQKRQKELGDLEAKHLTQMSRSSKKLEEEHERRSQKMETWHKLEEKKLASVLQKFEHNNKARTTKVLEEHARMEEKRGAADFRALHTEKREMLLHHRQRAEQKRQHKIINMNEEDKERRQDLLRKTMEHLETNDHNRLEHLQERSQHTHARNEKAMTQALGRFRGVMREHEGRRLAWSERDHARLAKLMELKSKAKAHQEQVAERHREEIRKRHLAQAAELSAAVTKRLDATM